MGCCSQICATLLWAMALALANKMCIEVTCVLQADALRAIFLFSLCTVTKDVSDKGCFISFPVHSSKVKSHSNLLLMCIAFFQNNLL